LRNVRRNRRSIKPTEEPVGDDLTRLLGTLGFKPEKFLGAIKTIPGVTHVTFYTAYTGRTQDKRRSVAAARSVERALAELNVPFDAVVLPNPFDFAGMLRRFIHDLQLVDARDSVFNITGGSKPMSMAAAIACMMAGVRTYYVPEEQEGAQAILLPIFRLNYSRLLTPRQREIMRLIAEETPRSERDLASRLGVKESTLSGHLRRLGALGAVALPPDPKQTRIHRPQLTEAGRLMLSIEEEVSPHGD